MNMQINNQFARAIRSGFRHGATGSDSHALMDHPLTNEELHKLAPSVFAPTAHESRSARFTPVPTISVIEGLRNEGFLPFAAKQAKCREEGRADFTKHLVRFRRPEDNGTGSIWNKDAIAEVVLVNANDGTSSYQLYAGFFRTLCFNGLVVADGTIKGVRVGHTGNIVNKVIEGSYTVIDQTKKALVVRDDWSALELKPAEQMAFARAAHALRFEEREEGMQPNAIQPEKLLTVRRDADAAPNLWTVFNRVQENAVRGGLVGFTKSGYFKNDEGQEVYKPSRRVETRAVKGIDQDVKLNKALWTLATEMAALKAA